MTDHRKRLSFQAVEVLQNVDQERRTTIEIRGALRLTIRQVSGLLIGHRDRGYVESSFVMHRGIVWQLTPKGRQFLDDILVDKVEP